MLLKANKNEHRVEEEATEQHPRKHVQRLAGCKNVVYCTIQIMANELRMEEKAQRDAVSSWRNGKHTCSCEESRTCYGI